MNISLQDFTWFQIFSGENAIAGNPAAVYLYQLPTSYKQPQAIHQQRPDMTFVYINPLHDNHFHIRWYQGQKEILRCGHGTLAACAYLQPFLAYRHYIFHSQQETIQAQWINQHWLLSFTPAKLIEQSPDTLPLPIEALWQTPEDKGYMICELKTPDHVKQFQLTPEIIRAIGQRALIISAKMSDNNQYDIIFRYFAPQYGIPEDSATGSAGAVLYPFWAARLNKKSISCLQASKAKGEILLGKNQGEITVSGNISSHKPAAL